VAAEVYGTIRADLSARGLMIGANDLLIAAIAMANQITLVTHNTSEFGRISGLLLEDWQTP
jgi:tRNA(fMet)-specific endonuclease VapC